MGPEDLQVADLHSDSHDEIPSALGTRSGGLPDSASAARTTKLLKDWTDRRELRNLL
jgi:hypothetical protein